MNFPGILLLVLLGLCAFARPDSNGRLTPLHRILKRQVDNEGLVENSDRRQQQHGHRGSVTHQRHSSSSSRHYVSPDGQPYYEYRPPVSSSRGSSGGRAASSQVSIRGQGSARQPSRIYSGRVRQSQTYTYPFGRERTTYYYDQSQTETTTSRPSAEYDQWRTQDGQYRRQFQTSYQSSSHQGAGTDDRRRSGQQSTNQQAVREEERRRAHEEARRRHEEHRRRQEERRALYYAQQEANQQARDASLNDDSTQSPVSITEPFPTLQTTQSTQARRQQTYDQRRRPRPRYTGFSQGGQSSGSSTYSQGPHTSGQRTVYRASTGQQQSRGYLPSNQQPGYRTSSTQRRQYTSYQRPRYTNYRPGTNQQGWYNPNNQQPVYRTSGTNQQDFYNPFPITYTPIYGSELSAGSDPNRQDQIYRPRTTRQEIIPNQRSGSGSQVYSQGSRQVDPRRVLTNQRGTYPGFRTSYEAQGQGYRYPYSSGSSSSGSGYQPRYLDCPETGIDLRIDGMGCQQAIQQLGSYLCYSHEHTSRECCEICRARKQPSRVGCEFGDHAQLCSNIVAADCYDLRNRQSCCETCERLVRRDAIAGCEYGDMTARCESVRQSPGLCYIPDNQRLCCQTCSQIRNATNSGCPWGDFNPSLCQLFDEQTSNVRINCYSEQRRRLCCQSCERLREWLPDDLPADCQYGDRPVIFNTSQFGRLNCSTVLSHFSVNECRTNPAVSVNCCHTCHRHLQGRG